MPDGHAGNDKDRHARSIRLGRTPAILPTANLGRRASNPRERNDMSIQAHQTAPTQFTYATAVTQYVQAGATRFAYRRMGRERGVPLLFMQNFRQSMDSVDPLLLDGFGQDRPVIIFDNAGVSSSGGQTPDTIEAMADDVASFIGALELPQVDVLG